MSGARHWEQDKEATVYIGNLDERVTDSLVWELMLQAGRIVNVHLPKDRVTQSHQGYGFVEFVSEEDAEYAAKIMNQVRLYGKPIRVNKASADKLRTVEVGAELFVGNLDPLVTEQVLYDTFSRFGALVAMPKVARDQNGLSKGYGFVSFGAFEASDDAIANMSGQFLMNKEVTVQYAYKKDGKGERHGDQAERMLAAQARKHNVQPTSTAPPPIPGAPPLHHPPPPALQQHHPLNPANPAPLPHAPPAPLPAGFGAPMPAAPAGPYGAAPRAPHPQPMHRGGLPPPPEAPALPAGYTQHQPYRPGLPTGPAAAAGMPSMPGGLPARPPPSSQAGYAAAPPPGPTHAEYGGAAAPPRYPANMPPPLPVGFQQQPPYAPRRDR